MTVTITEAVRALFLSGNALDVTGPLGLIAIALLTLLLLLREALRAQEDRMALGRMRGMDVAVAPLLLTCAVILLARFLRLAQLL